MNVNDNLSNTLCEAELKPDHDLAVLVLALVQEVLRLEVPVHHALAVHVGDGVEHLGC